MNFWKILLSLKNLSCPKIDRQRYFLRQLITDKNEAHVPLCVFLFRDKCEKSLFPLIVGAVGNPM